MRPARAPLAAVAVLGAAVLTLLSGCFGEDADHPARDVDRQFVQYHLVRSCLAEAGYHLDGAVTRRETRGLDAAWQRCQNSANLFTLPSLTERVRMYHDELAAARCLGKLGYDTVAEPTLSDYLADDPYSSWTPFTQLTVRPGDELLVTTRCPEPTYR
jgi:hypothetical protein